MSKWQLAMGIFFVAGTIMGAAVTLLVMLVLHGVEIVLPAILPFAIASAVGMCLSLLMVRELYS